MTAKLNTVKLPRALVALLMGFAILLGTVATGLAVLETDAADTYTTCASNTVTWQMIKDNPGCYYWYYEKGNTYCVLTAVESGSAHYVTLTRPDKSETRYLKLSSNDDSASKYDWGSKAHTGVLYYKGNTSYTYYAKLTYNANGGSGAPSAQTGNNSSTSTSANVTFTIPNTTPTRSGYTFLGWAESSSAITPSYYAGNAYTISASSTNSSNPTPKTLYAVWQDAGAPTIKNPATATGNDLKLSKTLSYNSASDSYTITLTGQATSSGSSYALIATNKSYTYATLSNGNYYYSADGRTVYQLKGYAKSSDKYYIYYSDGSNEYGLDKDGTFVKGKDQGEKAKSTSKSILSSSDFKSNSTIYEMTGSGTTHGATCVLKDTINTTYFDVSSATVTASPSSATRTIDRSNGLVTATNYDYTGNYGGTPLTVTISGIKARDNAYGNTVASNSGNAGIYASSSASSALVSVVSPTVTIPEKQQEEDKYTFSVANMVYNYSTGVWTNASDTVTDPVWAIPIFTITKNGSAVTFDSNQYSIKYTIADTGIVIDDPDGDIDGWLVAQKKPGTTNVTAVLCDRDGNELSEPYTFTVTVTGLHTINWYTYNGTLISSEYKTAGESYSYTGSTPSPAPSTSGYTHTWLGWSGTQNNITATSATLGKNSTSIAPSSTTTNNTVNWYATYSRTANSKTYYAQLSYNANGGSGAPNSTSGAGTSTGTSANVPFTVSSTTPTRDGYTFKGWATTQAKANAGTVDYSAGDSYNITATSTDANSPTAKILYAVWEQNVSYDLKVQDVTLYLSDGHFDGASDAEYYSGDNKGWVYIKYTLNGTSYTSNNGYRFVFDSDDTSIADHGEDSDTHSDFWFSIYGNPGKTTVTAKMYNESDVVGIEPLATATFTVTVVPETYTVTWQNDDGTTLEIDEKVEAGTMPNYDGSTPTKTSTAQYDYFFAGWSPEITAVNGDATYTATYIATLRYYTVTWKNADGTVLETDENVAFGEMPTYDGSTPSIESSASTVYTFAGWSPQIDTVSGNVIYTATYTETPRKYTVQWLDSDGTTSLASPEQVAYGNTAKKPADPTKEGYTFKGWSTNKDATEPDANIPGTITSDTTYYAIWEEDFIPETDASTDKKMLPAVTLLAVLATIATSAVLAADPRRRRRDEE